MFDYMLTKEQLKIRDEARELVKWVPRQMILDMDADVIKFPKEFLSEAGKRNLLGCRYPKQWGGREMDWVTSAMRSSSTGRTNRRRNTSNRCSRASFSPPSA